MKQVKTKQSRLLEAFSRGRKLTAAQIAAQFDIANPRATVSDIRSSGYKIELERTATSKGVVSKYFLV